MIEKVRCYDDENVDDDDDDADDDDDNDNDDDDDDVHCASNALEPRCGPGAVSVGGKRVANHHHHHRCHHSDYDDNKDHEKYRVFFLTGTPLKR